MASGGRAIHFSSNMTSAMAGITIHHPHNSASQGKYRQRQLDHHRRFGCAAVATSQLGGALIIMLPMRFLPALLAPHGAAASVA